MSPKQRRQKKRAGVGSTGAQQRPTFADYFVPNAASADLGLDDIQKIFNLALTGYEADIDHILSTSTRKTGNYDKHLDPNLRLKEVAYCGDMEERLADVAGCHYEKYKRNLGPPPVCADTDFSKISSIFPTEKVRVASEQGIVIDYQRTMAGAMVPIVSALAFETPSWKQRYLAWTTELKQDKAIADAALRIDIRTLPRDEVPREHNCPYVSQMQIPGQKRRQSIVYSDLECTLCDNLNPWIKQLKDVQRYFPNILLYEFKSLKSGSWEHLVALLAQTCDQGGFRWGECDNRCTHAVVSPPVTGSPTGFDATNPVIQLVGSNWAETDVGRSFLEDHVVNSDKMWTKDSARDMTQQVSSSLA